MKWEKKVGARKLENKHKFKHFIIYVFIILPVMHFTTLAFKLVSSSSIFIRFFFILFVNKIYFFFSQLDYPSECVGVGHTHFDINTYIYIYKFYFHIIFF